MCVAGVRLLSMRVDNFLVSRTGNRQENAGGQADGRAGKRRQGGPQPGGLLRAPRRVWGEDKARPFFFFSKMWPSSVSRTRLGARRTIHSRTVSLRRKIFTTHAIDNFYFVLDTGQTRPGLIVCSRTVFPKFTAGLAPGERETSWHGITRARV